MSALWFGDFCAGLFDVTLVDVTLLDVRLLSSVRCVEVCAARFVTDLASQLDTACCDMYISSRCVVFFLSLLSYSG